MDGTLTDAVFLQLLARDAPAEEYDEPLRAALAAGAGQAELDALEEAKALALQVRRALEHRRRREAELAALFETAGDLAGLQGVDAVLDAIVRRARTLLHTDVAYLTLIDAERGDTYMRATPVSSRRASAPSGWSSEPVSVVWSPGRRRRAGFAPGSEFLWEFHYQVYWDLTQRIYREEFDPGYDGATEAGTPFCASGTPACDADYDYASRPAAVPKAVRKVELTGRIAKPLLTLGGTLDTLLPPATDSDVYAELVRSRGRGGLHRYYVIEDGNHVDGLYDAYPTELRPILPCYRDALTALDHWVSAGEQPPASGLVPRPLDGDLANTCSIG